MIRRYSSPTFLTKSAFLSAGPVTLILLIFTLNLNSQTWDPFIQSKVNELNYDSVYNRLEAFENLGIKEVGTSALDQTASWIIEQHLQFGYSDIKIDSFYIDQDLVYNIIVTKSGTTFPDTYLIVDGHYDTYNGPGVNDNGSGTAIVLEVARMMADVETEYSIKFIHFTAEEIGLVGSEYYVENTVIPQDMDIRLVFNIDEVGGVAGEINNTITCERDEWMPNGNNAASAAFTDTLANLTELYSNLNTYISYAYGSDYVPFMINGYVVTGFYETNESPYPHSINDSLSNLDSEYIFEITKASLASSMYFAKSVGTSTGLTIDNNNQKNIALYPVPFDSYFNVENSMNCEVRFELYNIQGQFLEKFYITSNSINRVEPKQYQNIYFYIVSDNQGELVDSGKLLRR